MNAELRIIGRLGKDAEIVTIADKTAIKFSIAITRDKDKDVSRWFNCTKFGATGVAEYLKKGTQVYVCGEHKVRVSKNADGTTYVNEDITIRDLNLLGSKATSSAPTQQQAPITQTNDLPF